MFYLGSNYDVEIMKSLQFYFCNTKMSMIMTATQFLHTQL